MKWDDFPAKGFTFLNILNIRTKNKEKFGT